MKWTLLARGAEKRKVEIEQPLLASWEKRTHPAQVRLRDYVQHIVEELSLPPNAQNLFLHMDVDVEKPDRLLHHYDLENYLTPLFGMERLPYRQFVLVSARKKVGGGSRIVCGLAEPVAGNDQETWSHLSLVAGSGTSHSRWKEDVHKCLAQSGVQPIPAGPVAVRLAWRCSYTKRNWTTLWKPTGDAMGPILGIHNPSQPFNPEDDRIVNLELQVNPDESIGHGVVVGMWWKHVM